MEVSVLRSASNIPDICPNINPSKMQLKAIPAMTRGGAEQWFALSLPTKEICPCKKAASINITCFCGFGIVALITEIYGRKKAVCIGTIPLILSWVLTYFSTHNTTLYISRFFAGISFGCTLFLNYINIGEYVSPNIRLMTTNMLLCAASLTGTMIGQVLSIVMEWRNVALIGIIPSILSAIIPFFWVESPMWLASQGRFEECEVAFNSLRTPSKAAEEELKLLLSTENRKNKKYKKKTFVPVALKKIRDALNQRYFWKFLKNNMRINFISCIPTIQIVSLVKSSSSRTSSGVDKYINIFCSA
ncbi:sugar transporter ERD6-like 15 [Zerene cesonia]|uniref:sugar transporter ERD6-like 15 n=1 Tax=Zerene cesonia TaxID=33412 RepID=UPI0018E5463C|nr:sugar transporter ERD6-like 15 [Zerene cesonia]